MNTATMTSAANTARPVSRAGSMPLSRTLALYGKEIRYEFMKLFRNRGYLIATIGFPVMFYLLFGVANRHAAPGGFSIATYLLAGYCCFGMIGASLFGIGIGFAFERSLGWLEVKQASPMPPTAYILAKLVSSCGFAILIAFLLITIGILFAGVHITPLQIAKLVGIMIAGAIPFATLGLLIGLLAPANATPGIINMIYLPMSFCSGLWMPLSILPHWLQMVAPFLPAYHFSQLALRVVGYSESPSSATNWIALAAFAVLFGAIDWFAFRHMQQKA